jgi:hypothetical protein
VALDVRAVRELMAPCVVMGDRPDQFPLIQRCKTCPLGTLTSDTNGARTMGLEQIECSDSQEVSVRPPRRWCEERAVVGRSHTGILGVVNKWQLSRIENRN